MYLYRFTVIELLGVQDQWLLMCYSRGTSYTCHNIFPSPAKSPIAFAQHTSHPFSFWTLFPRHPGWTCPSGPQPCLSPVCLIKWQSSWLSTQLVQAPEHELLTSGDRGGDSSPFPQHMAQEEVPEKHQVIHKWSSRKKIMAEINTHSTQNPDEKATFENNIESNYLCASLKTRF